MAKIQSSDQAIIHKHQDMKHQSDHQSDITQKQEEKSKIGYEYEPIPANQLDPEIAGYNANTLDGAVNMQTPSSA